ncbi:hypothetical protein ATCC90586_007380 [Pythium insidiosum]|nr:hypothetical protein ATCC90586_007380 [Pythium insidiosum]
MRLAASLLLATAVSANSNDKPSQDGQWAPCGYSTPDVQITDEEAPFECLKQKVPLCYDGISPFECLKQKVPLCYDGICESKKEIDFFVRRRLATNETTDGVKRAVIIIQGGPGAGSYQLEPLMTILQDHVDGAVDFYTFDHRGTGLSEFLNEFLKCDGVRTNSEEGIGLTLNELAGCLDEINTKYDGQAAGFSVTSAARDVQHIINNYGTYLTQRLMQLEIPQVKGYIFDGVDARSDKGDEIETSNSHWNQAIHAPSKRLLEYCAADESCPLKLKSVETAYEEVLDMYKRIDAETQTNECLKKLLTIDDKGTLLNSTTLSSALAGMVQHTGKRAEAVKALADLQACLAPSSSRHHKNHKKQHTQPLDLGEFPEPITNQSKILYNVVVFSERWAQPAPTKQERLKFFTGGPFSLPSEPDAQAYCLSDSGNGALMVTFDYGNHCTGESTVFGEPSPCRDSILMQFVLNDGDIDAVSLECMDSVPTLNFEVPVAPEGEAPASKKAHKKHHKKHGKHHHA